MFKLTARIGGHTKTATAVIRQAKAPAQSPPAPFSPAISSDNWSGYILTGQPGGYQGVSAEWYVPTIACVAPNAATGDWIGVNGNSASNPGLFQTGTGESCVNGQAQDYAWFTDQADNFAGQNQFSVNPGDLIFAEIWQTSDGQWAWYIVDVTSGQSAGNTEPYSGLGLSAEWIAEDPGDPQTGGLYPLARFSPVNFFDLGLFLSSGSWPNVTAKYACEMSSSNGAPMATPSPIIDYGNATNFTVNYGGSTANAQLHARSVATLRSTYLSPHSHNARVSSRSTGWPAPAAVHWKRPAHTTVTPFALPKRA